VPAEIQCDVLVFDWWIHNGDRTLSETGGNPNLFWDPSDAALLVLDHNQAFDPDFDPADFRRFHAFGRLIPALFDDLVRQSDYAKRLELGLERWDAILAEIPPEWWFVDAEMTVSTLFDAPAALELLTRCRHNEFWTLP
jgi:hypothetical protein